MGADRLYAKAVVVLVAAGAMVGRFRPPRPIDGRMAIGALLIFAGVVFLIQALVHLA